MNYFPVIKESDTEECGGVTVALNYWDCGCLDAGSFIHSNDEKVCHNCGCTEDDMPNARVNEINLYGVVQPSTQQPTN